MHISNEGTKMKAALIRKQSGAAMMALVTITSVLVVGAIAGFSAELSRLTIAREQLKVATDSAGLAYMTAAVSNISTDRNVVRTTAEAQAARIFNRNCVLGVLLSEEESNSVATFTQRINPKTGKMDAVIAASECDVESLLGKLAGIGRYRIQCNSVVTRPKLDLVVLMDISQSMASATPRHAIQRQWRPGDGSGQFPYGHISYREMAPGWGPSIPPFDMQESKDGRYRFNPDLRSAWNQDFGHAPGDFREITNLPAKDPRAGEPGYPLEARRFYERVNRFNRFGMDHYYDIPKNGGPLPSGAGSPSPNDSITRAIFNGDRDVTDTIVDFTDDDMRQVFGMGYPTGDPELRRALCVEASRGNLEKRYLFTNSGAWIYILNRWPQFNGGLDRFQNDQNFQGRYFRQCLTKLQPYNTCAQEVTSLLDDIDATFDAHIGFVPFAGIAATDSAGNTNQAKGIEEGHVRWCPVSDVYRKKGVQTTRTPEIWKEVCRINPGANRVEGGESQAYVYQYRNIADTTDIPRGNGNAFMPGEEPDQGETASTHLASIKNLVNVRLRPHWGTDTGGALRQALRMFNRDAGVRADAKKAVILLTDGIPHWSEQKNFPNHGGAGDNTNDIVYPMHVGSDRMNDTKKQLPVDFKLLEGNPEKAAQYAAFFARELGNRGIPIYTFGFIHTFDAADDTTGNDSQDSAATDEKVGKLELTAKEVFSTLAEVSGNGSVSYVGRYDEQFTGTDGSVQDLHADFRRFYHNMARRLITL